MKYGGIVFSGLLVLIFFVAAGMAGCPAYNVYSAGMHGRAQLAEANFARQSLVAKARAENEAAELYAQAEVTRAQGAAKAAQIISKSLEGNPNYLQYLAIQSQKEMADSPNHTTIYIPTGANGIPLIGTYRAEAAR